MKLFFNVFFILLTIQGFQNEAYSLTNWQIKKICKEERKKSNCIRNLQHKRSKLLKGNRIEIPVIPFRK